MIKPIADLAPEDFDYTVDINLKGVWLSCKYALETMRRQVMAERSLTRLLG